MLFKIGTITELLFGTKKKPIEWQIYQIHKLINNTKINNQQKSQKPIIFRFIPRANNPETWIEPEEEEPE